MLDAIGASQAAMEVDQLKLQSVSHNVANMNTPGFKKSLLERTHFEEELQNSAADPLDHLQTTHITNQGVLNQTHHLTDLALSGAGYFQVQNDKGIVYTRRGDFQINAQGQLALPSGEVLLGNAGAIKVDDSTFKIDAQGILYSNNHPIGQIELVQFKKNDTLDYLGNGLYQSEASPTPAASTTRVLQGFIEQSNVQSMDEMMELLKISRHFEVSQRIMRTADGLLATAINKLGEGNV